MNRPTRIQPAPQDPTRTPRQPRTDTDVALAARTDACVLLSGRPDAARDLAYRLHLASGWRHGPFTVIDCAAGDAEVEATIMDALFPRVSPADDGVLHLRLAQAGTVLLQEVNRLPLEVQVRLAAELTRAHGSLPPAKSRRRLMASSSEALIDRIKAGTFDDRLYYRLNLIHFAAPDLDAACTARL